MIKLKPAARKFSLFVFLLILPLNYLFPNDLPLNREAKIILKTAAAVQVVFQTCKQEIWPGYDLSGTPYLLYLPDAFCLYLNPVSKPAGFETYPADWPQIGSKALIYKGRYPGLSGQFSFNFKLDSLKLFAMGLPPEIVLTQENPALSFFGTTVHEGFHYFQAGHFGPVPWAREEQYPILDAQNNALAALELLILENGLKALFNNEKKSVEKWLKWFVAVRFYRWQTGSPFLQKYEQGQEINEGTARYVEMKATFCLLKLNEQQIENEILIKFKRQLRNLTVKEIILQDVNRVLKEQAIAPEDMARNRIYPLGAALGFLLDDLHINWKIQFQQAGNRVAFHRLLTKALQIDSTNVFPLVQKAQHFFNFKRILERSRRLVDEYLSGYRKALAQFNNQPGVKVMVELPANGLQRFRSSKEKKWIIDQGALILCPKYNLYLLQPYQSGRFKLEVHNKALLDKSNFAQKSKTVVFFIPKLDSLQVDNEWLSPEKEISAVFKSIVLSGRQFYFQANCGGKIIKSGKLISVKLDACPKK